MIVALAVMALGLSACDGVSETDAGPTDASVPSCGPENCTGCCDGTRCQSGESLAACGQGGVACEVCGIGVTCEVGGCGGGSTCGPGNCDGCCMGDTCVGGDGTACGMGGEACAVCQGWEGCVAGVCGVDPASMWQVEILDATIPPTQFDGSDWDGVGAGEVDVFVEIRVATVAVPAFVMPTIDDTLTPDWTAGGTTTALSPTVTAADILMFLRFDLFDEDVAIDDPIGTCRYDEGETPFNGEIVTFVCAPDASLGHAGYTLRWRLVPG